MRLPTFLRREFFKTTRDSNMLDGSANFITSEKWLDEKLKSMFNRLADIISNQGGKTNDNKTENDQFDKVMTQNPSIKCWLS